MKLYSLLIGISLLGIFHGYGQEGSLSGKLEDQREESLPFATVAVLKMPDSTVVTGTTTDMDGTFRLKSPEKGKYVLRFSAIGFESTFTPLFEVANSDFSKDFGSVTIREEMTMLNEVMIETWRPRIEVEPGKMVVRVENTALAAGSTAYEVVSKSPGITVDQDGDLSLNGKAGVEVIINGRETYLSADQLKNLLESMPAENIRNIEFIHSPSAKYPAAGTAGLINIVLKENVTIGFNGSMYAGAELNDENWYNAGTNLSYGRGKWNSFLSADLQKTGFNREQRALREFTNEGQYDYYDQQGKQLEVRWVPSLRAGVDYQVDENHSIGAVANYTTYEEEGYWNTESELGTYEEGNLVNVEALNSSEEFYTNARLNFHYVGDLDTLGTVLSADVDFARLNKNRDSFFENYYNYVKAEDESEFMLNRSISSYDIIAAQADLTVPLNSRSDFSIGVKGSRVISDSDLKFYLQENGSRELDSGRSNSFKYEEEIYAAYVSYSNELSDTWNIQLGLRAEKTLGEGISPTTGETNRRDYINFFPNIQVSQNVSENYQIAYSYNRRIKRPRYSTLNPFLFYLDPYTYIVGNPDLDASITSSYKITQNFFDKYQLILSYDDTDGPMGEYPRLDEETGNTIFTTANLDRRTSYAATLIVPVTIGSFWNITNTIIANQMNYKIAYGNELIENDNLFYSFQSNHQINLPWDMQMEIIGAYSGPTAIDIYQLEHRWFVDVGLKKSFMNDRLTATLKANDIFDGQQFRVTGAYPGSTFDMSQHFYSRGVSFNLRYKFNGTGKKEEARQDSLEELERAGG